MKHYSFTKTPEELMAFKASNISNFFMQEKIQAAWLFSEEVYRKLLPPGLDPVAPVAYAYVANFARPSNLYPYSEGALFILCSWKGEVGTYCLAMPLDGNDQAQNAGREFYGYPKKSARVKLMRRGDEVEGWIERNDVRFFSIKAKIGEFNDPVQGPEMIGIKNCPTETLGPCYLLDYRTIPPADEFFEENGQVGMENILDKVFLVKQMNRTVFKSQEKATVELHFEESCDDPWAELEPLHVFGAEYCVYDTYMKGSTVIKTFDMPEERKLILPYLFTRWDTTLFGKYHASYKASNFYR